MRKVAFARWQLRGGRVRGDEGLLVVSACEIVVSACERNDDGGVDDERFLRHANLLRRELRATKVVALRYRTRARQRGRREARGGRREVLLAVATA